MKIKQIYICEICKKSYDSPEEALACEKQGVQTLEDLKITHPYLFHKDSLVKANTKPQYLMPNIVVGRTCVLSTLYDKHRLPIRFMHFTPAGFEVEITITSDNIIGEFNAK